MILVAMLDLIPVGVFSRVGAVYAEGDGGGEETPEIAEVALAGTGPTSDTPEQLGLPEDTGAPGFQNDCSLPGNTCEKEEGSGLGDVNEVGEGETYVKQANVVVIKAGNQEFFYKPDGPSCNSLSDPYCVFWGGTSITVVRNLEGRDNKEISNIQFWVTGDDDDDTGDDDDDTGDDDDDTGDDDDDTGDDDDDTGDDDDDTGDDDDDTGDDDDDTGDDDDDTGDDDDDTGDDDDDTGDDDDDTGDDDDDTGDDDDDDTGDDDDDTGDDDDDEQERYNLVLDPYCIEMNGGYFLVWEIINPNNFSVDATWTLDGAGAGGSLAPGTTFVGYTEDGPATHTLHVTWGFGQASSSSSEVCAPKKTTTTTTTPNAFTPPADPEPLIPVTGVDLSGDFFLRRMLFSLGILMVGLSLVAKGTANKIRK
jgi:hypothetical protein